MKCPGCGSENPDQARLCRFCGKPLPTLRETMGSRREPSKELRTSEQDRTAFGRSTSQPFTDGRTITDKIKFNYSHGLKDNTQRTLEGVQTLLTHLQSPQIDLDVLLRAAAEFIWRQFGIDNVAIGLRDPKDGLYRYRAMVGFRGDALEAHKNIAYRREQFFENDEFHGTKISKYSTLYLAEDNVLSDQEKSVYNRPGLLTVKRNDPTDSLEGDYIDTCIYGSGDELLGWIEFSGTRTMKLPDLTTVRWVEVIALMIAATTLWARHRDVSR